MGQRNGRHSSPRRLAGKTRRMTAWDARDARNIRDARGRTGRDLIPEEQQLAGPARAELGEEPGQ